MSIFSRALFFLAPLLWSNVALVELHMASARAQRNFRISSVHELKDLFYYAQKIHQFSAHFLYLVKLFCEA